MQRFVPAMAVPTGEKRVDLDRSVRGLQHVCQQISVLNQWRLGDLRRRDFEIGGFGRIDIAGLQPSLLRRRQHALPESDLLVVKFWFIHVQVFFLHVVVIRQLLAGAVDLAELVNVVKAVYALAGVANSEDAVVSSGDLRRRARSVLRRGGFLDVRLGVKSAQTFVLVDDR